ncbi:MAG: hypothetical protein RIQ89_1962 [Bacteroidota bacterium]|jgi:murein DD-endopeptidase / murein LD-carboxypeptidase
MGKVFLSLVLTFIPFISFSQLDEEQPILEALFIKHNFLGVLDDTVYNPNLYPIFATYLGTPYKYGGNSLKAIDCSGFTGKVFSEGFKVSLPRNSNDIFKQCDTISNADLIEGDLLFFKIRSNQVSHIAIYISSGKFIHASTQRGVVVSNLNDPYYMKYYYCAGRLKIEK